MNAASQVGRLGSLRKSALNPDCDRSELTTVPASCEEIIVVLKFNHDFLVSARSIGGLVNRLTGFYTN